MQKSKNILLRWLPLIILVVALVCFFYFQLYRYLSFSMLKEHRYFLTQWTEQHRLISALLLMLIYIAVVAISIPVGTILTLAAGFLFGVVFGTIYVVVGATMGACVVFLAVKTSLGSTLAERHGKWLVKFENNLQENAFNYLLFLRLVPVFPFWIINIAAGLLNVSLGRFFLATLIGIIPGSLVYTAVGNGLGAILDKGGEPNLGIIFTPAVLLPLLGLSILSIVSIIHKRIMTKKNA